MPASASRLKAVPDVPLAPGRRPTGTIPAALRVAAITSPVARWWVPVLTKTLRVTTPRATQLPSEAVRRHRAEDDAQDPLVIPSEWGVF